MKTANKKLNLDLSELDGNAYCLLGTFRRQAKSEDWAPEEIQAVIKEAMSGNYDHLLATLVSHCE